MPLPSTTALEIGKTDTSAVSDAVALATTALEISITETVGVTDSVIVTQVAPDIWTVTVSDSVLAEGGVPERRAAVLALRSSPHAGAKALLARHAVELPAGCDWAHLG